MTYEYSAALMEAMAAIGSDMDPHDQPVVDDDDQLVWSAVAAALETLPPAQRIVLDAMVTRMIAADDGPVGGDGG